MNSPKRLGVVSIIAGLISCLGVLGGGFLAIVAAVIGIACGSIAIQKGEKLLGGIGLALSLVVPIVFIAVWLWLLFSGGTL